MADHQFKSGDIVQLKSGGPTMTVEEIDGTQANCVWFEGTKHKTGLFELSALESAEHNRQPPPEPRKIGF
jgi:uncharacterized protein YodC (DUF2158 family)